MGLIQDLKVATGRDRGDDLLNFIAHTATAMQEMHSLLQEMKASETPGESRTGGILIPNTSIGDDGTVAFYPLVPRNARRKNIQLFCGSNIIYVSNSNLDTDGSVGAFINTGIANNAITATTIGAAPITGNVTIDTAGPLWVANVGGSSVGVGFVENIFVTPQHKPRSIFPGQLLSAVYNNGELAAHVKGGDDTGQGGG